MGGRLQDLADAALVAGVRVLAGGSAVDAESLFPASARVFEVADGDFSLACALRRRGHTRLIAGLCGGEGPAFAALRLRAPELADALVHCQDRGQLTRNDADVLVLSDPSIRVEALGRHRHAARVVCAPARGLAGVRAAWRFVTATGRGAGRLRFVGIARLSDASGRARPLLVADNRGRKPETARRFLPHGLGVQAFCSLLHARGIRYVVLRWFDTLPRLAPGEDLDLLVADEDVEAVERILAWRPGFVPVDLYSVSGLPGTAFRRMAYFPPAVARGILARSELSRPPYRVPSARDHFLSLAYHVVYHKGEASGLPCDEPDLLAAAAPDHDYVAVLSRLAAGLGAAVPIRLESLDAHLADAGWRPPLDTLARLARRNAWLGRQVARLVAASASVGPPGLAVFLVRQQAVVLGWSEEIAKGLEQAGFEIVARAVLSETASARLTRRARGGNWGSGPYARSGGAPAHLLVAFDPNPREPDQTERSRHPGLENARVLVKSELRDRLNDRLEASQRFNPIHSSDHAWGAVEYLRLALPDSADEILAAVERRARRGRTGVRARS